MNFRNLSRKQKVILAVIPILFLTGAVAAQILFLNATTNTFTVGTYLSVQSVDIFYNKNVAVGGSWSPVGGTDCTGTLPTMSCNEPTTTIFAGDNISLSAVVYTQKTSLTPTVTVTSNPSTYTAFTPAAFYIQCASTSCSTFTGSVVAGLPTMTANTYYVVLLFAKLAPTAPTTGSLSFNFALNA